MTIDYIDFDFNQISNSIRTEGNIIRTPSNRIGDTILKEGIDHIEEVSDFVSKEVREFDPDKIVEFIPTFVVVFASIILAQLLSPLMTQLLMSVLGFVPMALSSKRPIIDAILAPFSLMLCDRPGGRSFSDSFRSLERELGWSETQANIAATFAETAFETISSNYQN